MDMSLSIKGGKIASTIYEKMMALYLYIPPHSAHPLDVLTGLIMGNTLRIHQLCTEEDNIASKMKVFFDRLLDCGHQQATQLPIFGKAIENAKAHSLRSKENTLVIKEAKKEASERSVYPYTSHFTQTTHHLAISRIYGGNMWHLQMKNYHST